MTTAHNREPSLYARARAALTRPLHADATAVSDRKLLHELVAQQLELQRQNEQLREMQLELEASRTRFRELYELAPIACLSLDSSTTIREANKAAGVLIGCRPDSLIGRRLSTLIAPEYAEPFEHHRRAVMSGEGRARCMLDLLLEGERREVRMDSMRTGTGASSQWRAALIDVTEVHRLQRRLQHAQKLEAMGTMASGIAHDVNNLLMAILGCAEMARGKLPPDSPARAPLDELARGALHGRVALAQLLTFARKSDAPAQVLHVHEALTKQAPVLRRLLGDAIALQLDLQAQHDAIRIEPGQLEQILLNLATNARHAMPAGGSVRIATRTRDPEELDRGARAELGPCRCLLLEVSDTGPGMDESVRARAFEPFFTTKPAGLGTGLGLSTVYGAVRQSGGHCQLRSRLGEGTAVHIVWPEVQSDDDHARSGTYRLVPLAPCQTVLVVDDDRLVRLAVRHYLEQGGYDVLDYESGEQALQVLRDERRPVHLLLSDVVLPGLRGPEIVKAAKALRPDLQVMLISAHAPELLLERGWLMPGVGLLRKPFTSDEVLSAVRLHLSTAVAV